MKKLLLVVLFLANGVQASELVYSTNAFTIAMENEPVKIRITSSGLTLYTFDNDVNGESSCYNGCARTWPPVIISLEESKNLASGLASVARRDGALQLTVNGKPVYKYAGDKALGDILGDGLGGVWHIIPLD